MVFPLHNQRNRFIQEDTTLMRKFDIIDTTLREGEQTPGVVFSLAEKKLIIEGLAKIGVPEVEAGISSRFHPCAGQLITYSRSFHPDLKLSLWCRCREEDISLAAELKPDILSLSIPVSDIHLEKRLQKSRSWAHQTMSNAIDFARRRNLTVAIGFEDATRSNVSFLRSMAEAAEVHGAVRIRLADTVGTGSPGQICGLVRFIRRHLRSCSLGVHTHNDFGMATANAVAALEAGADSADTAVLGLGERTGCARLEEIVTYLCLVKNQEKFLPEHLKPLAAYVARIAKKNIEGNRPVIGADIFTCETGLHLQGLQNDPRTYEPFAPERVGGSRRLLIGSKSGRRAILSHLTAANSKFAENLSDNAIRLIRETAGKMNRPLSDPELHELLRTMEEN